MSAVFCIVDPELKDRRGHYFDYDRTVVGEAARRGFAPVILSHRKIEAGLKTGARTIPTFALGIWAMNPHRQWGNSLKALPIAASFFLDLRRGTRAAGVDRDSTLFVPTSLGGHILGWALFALTYPPNAGPRIVLMLRFQDEFYDNSLLARLGFRLLERTAARNRVELVTDSHRLAEDYKALTSLRIGVVPIPHGDRRSAGSKPARSAERPLRFVALGDAREEKGFLEILDAVRIVPTLRPEREIEFVLHAYTPGSKNVRVALERFRERAPKNVTLVDVALAVSDYAALLDSADVVLLPYHAEFYRSRTSGPFAEAVAAGKPVIISDGTWMAECARALGVGIVCADATPTSLAQAVVAASREIARLEQKAREAAGRWSAYHNPGRFMDAILRSRFELPEFLRGARHA
ncbi:MAG TPA: glycosyltransferase [Casimicrobiaceae bacterium]|nr:glycosyltransferase [Casimicrobiaceae bacterium]